MIKHGVRWLIPILILLIASVGYAAALIPAHTCPADGGQVALVLQGGITIFNTATGDLHEWVADVPGATISYIAWSPDGRQLAFETNQGGTWSIYVIEGSESGEAVSLAKPLFDSPDAHEQHPVWSPDGIRIAYILNNILQVANADGSDSRDLAVPIYENSTFYLWTPDGSRLLYGDREVENWQVKSIHVGTGSISKIASGGKGWVYPFSLSSDNILLLMEETFDSVVRIFSIDVKTNLLTDFEVLGYDPRWSPDGTHIAYFTGFNPSGTEGYQIALMDAQGKGGTILNDSFKPQVLGDVDWSPDGKQLAFTVGTTDYQYNYHLHLMDVSTGAIQFFKNTYVSLTPSWRPCTIPQ